MVAEPFLLNVDCTPYIDGYSIHKTANLSSTNPEDVTVPPSPSRLATVQHESRLKDAFYIIGTIQVSKSISFSRFLACLRTRIYSNIPAKEVIYGSPRIIWKNMTTSEHYWNLSVEVKAVFFLCMWVCGGVMILFGYIFSFWFFLFLLFCYYLDMQISWRGGALCPSAHSTVFFLINYCGISQWLNISTYLEAEINTQENWESCFSQ